MGLSGQKPRIGFCLSLGWFMFECPRYCEIFGPGACAGVFDESRCIMRRAAKIDDNQREIVSALRRVGCSVQSLAGVGRGVPDLVVGFRNRNFLLEIKDGSKPQCKRKLTPDEQNFHSMWKGQVVIVENVDEALRAVGVTHGTA